MYLFDSILVGLPLLVKETKLETSEQKYLVGLERQVTKYRRIERGCPIVYWILELEKQESWKG